MKKIKNLMFVALLFLVGCTNIEQPVFNPINDSWNMQNTTLPQFVDTPSQYWHGLCFMNCQDYDEEDKLQYPIFCKRDTYVFIDPGSLPRVRYNWECWKNNRTL